jgi:hypothetical protein
MNGFGIYHAWRDGKCMRNVSWEAHKGRELLGALRVDDGVIFKVILEK